MFFLRKIRSFFKMLNSALSPNQVAAGACFGILAGFPPLGLHTLLLFTLAFLFKTSFTAMLLAFALFKLFSWILFPVSYEVGQFALESIPALEPLWMAIFNLPVLALMEFNHYVVLGSYILAFVVAIPSFIIVRRFVVKYRESFFDFLESKKSYQSLQHHKRLHKVIEWIVMGGGAKFDNRKERPSIFEVVRLPALFIMPAVVGFVLLVVALLSTFFIDRAVLGASSYIIGGEVAANQVSMHPFTGRVEVKGLSVQDPHAEAQNVLEVGTLVADISYFDLLTRRFVFDEVAVNEISFNIRREEDGTLNIDDVGTDEGGVDLSGYFDWLKDNAQSVDWLKLIVEYLRVRIDAFEAREQQRSIDPELVSQYKQVESSLPILAVRRIAVGQIHIVLEDQFERDGDLPRITMLDVVLEDFELPTSKARVPMKIGLRAHLNGQSDSYVELSALLDGRNDPPIEDYAFKAERIELAPFGALVGSTFPLGVTSGVAFASVELRSEGNLVSAENELRVEGLRLSEAAAGNSILGLAPEMTASAISGINRFAAQCPIEIGFTLDGTWDELSMQWDAELLKVARQGLIMEGSRRFTEDLLKIDQQLGSITDQLGSIGAEIDPIGDILDNIFGSDSGEEAGCLIQDQSQ